MAKLKFKLPNGIEGEYETEGQLTPEQHADYYAAMLAKMQASTSSRSKPIRSTPHSGTSEPVARPDYRDVAKYIEKKPNFEHTPSELLTQFYGRVLSSREPDATEYNAFMHRLRRAQKEIEQSNHGRFEALKSTEYLPQGKSIQRTTYKFITDSPLEPLLQDKR